MAHIIVKRPDGKLALWSTVVDDFIFEEVDRDSLINYWLAKYREELELRISQAEARGGDSPDIYSWEDCQRMKRPPEG